MTAPHSADSLSQLLAHLPKPNADFIDIARARQAQLTKPPGSLGRLEDLALFLAGWSVDGVPRAARVSAVIFAGNHGVTAQGISPYPSAVTAQMVGNFQSGGAAINALAVANDLTLTVVPLALDTPTGDITLGAAMTPDETASALQAGFDAVAAADADLLLIGEMGIGNTTIAAALAAHIYGGQGADWVGPGTGHSADGIALKARVVDAALARHADAPRTAFDTLRTLGGRELAAMAGALLAARLARIPVLVDGFVVTAALATLASENPDIAAHCIAAHTSAEPAHRQLLADLKLVPLLDLGLRLGEGSGAALAVPIVRAAAATHTRMATFAEAAVAGRSAAS